MGLKSPVACYAFDVQVAIRGNEAEAEYYEEMQRKQGL